MKSVVRDWQAEDSIAEALVFSWKFWASLVFVVAFSAFWSGTDLSVLRDVAIKGVVAAINGV